MALNFFNFTKSWRNKNDFPTYESNETKVRDDMQSLFDELKDGLNGLITNLFAGNIPFNATSAVAADNVQDAIEEVQSQIADIVIDQLPDNSVTSAKLADEAVTEDKIADGAVTADKLDDSALDGKADLVNGVLKGSQNAREIVSVDTPRTLALTDSGKLLIVESATKTVLTIPQNSSVAFPVGTEIEVYREGIGEVAFAFDGVSASVSEPDRDAQNRFIALKRWHSAALKKVGTNSWNLEYMGAGNGDSGTTDHSQLTNRDAANQHPISSINGLQTALDEKQATISDLSTIRSGASSGATAIQKSAQASKTDGMTQPVGIDSNGKLWALPGGSGSSVEYVTYNSSTFADVVEAFGELKTVKAIRTTGEYNYIYDLVYLNPDNTDPSTKGTAIFSSFEPVDNGLQVLLLSNDSWSEAHKMPILFPTSSTTNGAVPTHTGGGAVEWQVPSAGSATWSSVTGKPFNSIGSGLSVSGGVLSATGGGGVGQYIAQYGSTTIEDISSAYSAGYDIILSLPAAGVAIDGRVYTGTQYSYAVADGEAAEFLLLASGRESLMMSPDRFAVIYVTCDADGWSSSVYKQLVTSVNGETGDVTVSGGGGDDVFIINVTQSGSTYTPDKTYSEASAAYDAGKILIMRIDQIEYYAKSKYSQGISFSNGAELFEGDISATSYIFGANGTVTLYNESANFNNVVSKPTSSTPSGYVPTSNGSGGYSWQAQQGGGGDYDLVLSLQSTPDEFFTGYSASVISGSHDALFNKTNDSAPFTKPRVLIVSSLYYYDMLYRMNIEPESVSVCEYSGDRWWDISLSNPSNYNESIHLHYNGTRIAVRVFKFPNT